jgi:hypothetical protein
MRGVCDWLWNTLACFYWFDSITQLLDVDDAQLLGRVRVGVVDEKTLDDLRLPRSLFQVEFTVWKVEIKYLIVHVDGVSKHVQIEPKIVANEVCVKSNFFSFHFLAHPPLLQWLYLLPSWAN